MIRELGPVIAGLMVAGGWLRHRGAAGSMRVTEQIDALNTLGTDPIKKLVTPRVLAALIMLRVDDHQRFRRNRWRKRHRDVLPRTARALLADRAGVKLSRADYLHYLPNDLFRIDQAGSVRRNHLSNGCTTASRPRVALRVGLPPLAQSSWRAL